MRSRFKYSKYLAVQCDGFNRSHFIVASDPMRIVSVPYSLNAVSGVICLPVGNRRSLEHLDVEELVRKANGFLNAIGAVKASQLLHAHPKPVEATFGSPCGRGR